MFQQIRPDFDALRERIRAGFGRRAAAIALALVLEALLVMVLLGLSTSIVRRKDNSLAVFSMSADPNKPAAAEQARAPAEPDRQAPREAQRPAEQSQSPAPAAQQPAPAPVPLIALSPQQMAAANIDALRAPPAAPAPRRSMMGPPDTGTPGDSQRVGQAPNGQPLYAASWYREPYDNELRGYLSTAQGPGWGLIACRTVSDYRVEDCVGLDEYPLGSNINRAVLAAAWQFRVRPPRIGGRSQVGEWVRIRIDYSIRRK